MGAYLDSSTARHSACARILSLSQCLSIDFIFSEVAMDLLLIQRTGWSDSLGQNIFFFLLIFLHLSVIPHFLLFIFFLCSLYSVFLDLFSSLPLIRC